MTAVRVPAALAAGRPPSPRPVVAAPLQDALCDARNAITLALGETALQPGWASPSDADIDALLVHVRAGVDALEKVLGVLAAAKGSRKSAGEEK